MLRSALLASVALLLLSSYSLGQGAVQAVRGAADKLVEGMEKPSTGPEDPAEKTKVGAIDANAPAEFKETASGLKYRILRASDKRKPKANETVTVHYKGWLDDKKIFDSSYRRGETISFGLNQVIKGWTEGMQLVGEGGMIELYIPYKLGYGESGRNPIPPKADLHFIVELISVK